MRIDKRQEMRLGIAYRVRDGRMWSMCRRKRRDSRELFGMSFLRPDDEIA